MAGARYRLDNPWRALRGQHGPYWFRGSAFAFAWIAREWPQGEVSLVNTKSGETWWREHRVWSHRAGPQTADPAAAEPVGQWWQQC